MTTRPARLRVAQPAPQREPESAEPIPAGSPIEVTVSGYGVWIADRARRWFPATLHPATGEYVAHLPIADPQGGAPDGYCEVRIRLVDG